MQGFTTKSELPNWPKFRHDLAVFTTILAKLIKKS
jgi:hypothetical protein